MYIIFTLAPDRRCEGIGSVCLFMSISSKMQNAIYFKCFTQDFIIIKDDPDSDFVMVLVFNS